MSRTTSPAQDRRQRGSGTVLMLAVVCVAVLGLAAVLMFSAVSNAGAKAGTAADLAALAAADAARQLLPGDPCAVAAATAAANDATLDGCTRQGPGGQIVTVRVQVPVSPVGWLPPLTRAHSVARAGPPPQPWRGD
ncbi:hypothetical protein GCM10009715_15260 [Paeniglutamicibacter psychrophenolicus]|uniref:Secretion/DNA translocation related TadE-like protein n=1 Tax=Paeniglutamicibacter psychrophenolicus TaxID=257454 RepID=A0ABS4WC51_9MICC|nr:Rv3654c family TadE-like protein [Paeniglutamicibacter psychrophenolicus]MBP2373770.1 secretion/DNA translocation related TadE-like protein [Paeniglutamicibacter psychrophenolicus]